MSGLFNAIKPHWRRAAATLKQKAAARSRGRWILDLGMLAALGALAGVSAAAAASAWWPALETLGNLQVHIAAMCAAVMILALLVRSNGWTLIAGAVLVFNVVSVGVRLAPVTSCPVQTAATGEHPVRILTHNIWGWNRDLSAVENTLLKLGADVAVLQEVRPYQRPLLDHLRAEYPFQAICRSNPDCGIAILSRYPLERLNEVGGPAVSALETVLSIDGHKLVLVGTHVRRPFHGRAQSAEFQALTSIVSALPANAIVAGDFNSTLWSPNMARYVAESGVCASNAAQATWPHWLGPFGIPIDHIFLKSGVQLLSIATLDGTGSDHKALFATVDIP